MQSPESSPSGPRIVLAFALLMLLGAAAGGIWGRLDSRQALAADRAPGVESIPEPPMHDWPTPSVAIVLSGELHGYIEPCGCTGGQYGGLARRSTLIHGLRQQRGWNVVGFELGGAMDINRYSRVQSQMKFDFARNALAGMSYVNLGLGKEEALLRQDGLLTSSEEDKQKPNFQLRYLSANVRPYPGQGLEISQLFRVIDVPAVKTATGAMTKPVRIAVTSVLGESMSKEIGSDDFFQIAPPVEALKEVLPQMKQAKPDLMILLSNCKTEESTGLAKQFPEFQIVVSAGGPADPDFRAGSVGKTMFVHAGQKGKNVAVAGFYPTEPQPLRYELVSLDEDRFVNAPEVDAMMQQYQDRLRDERPDLRDNSHPPAHPSGSTYVGVQVCAECHTKAFAKWSETGHAHALEGLATGRSNYKGKWIDRTWDAECLACHVTGWDAQQATRFQSGYIDMTKTPLLADNQCENCHGPGSRHVTLESDGGSDAEIAAAREGMRLKLENADQKCLECHDTDNDPHFKFDTYWPQIEHPGKD